MTNPIPKTEAFHGWEAMAPGEDFSQEATQDPNDAGDRFAHASGPISIRKPTAKIGRYALFGQFAKGGMATVHFGRLDGAGGFSRVVAIKRLLPHLTENEEFIAMLLNEARLAARVRHPNVVPTLDVVASKGDVLLVLEYVHGEALSALCRIQAKQRQEHIPVPIAMRIILDALHGLHAVHEAIDEKGHPLGLIHRDVSPQNIIVGSEGVSRVLDFGVAKAVQRIEETASSRLKGKSGYMSPEQIRGERLTRRSDVFSAGIVLWELLTLRRMFSAPSETERMAQIKRGNYTHPIEHRAELGEELDAIVMRALAIDPEARFATMQDLAEALEKVSHAATARAVADWVNSLAQNSLIERARMLAQVENWNSELPKELSSGPFAAEAAIEISPLPKATTIRPQAPLPSPATNVSGAEPALASEQSPSRRNVMLLIAFLCIVVVVIAYVLLGRMTGI
jgi:serine/threonine-protein kinase